MQGSTTPCLELKIFSTLLRLQYVILITQVFPKLLYLLRTLFRLLLAEVHIFVPWKWQLIMMMNGMCGAKVRAALDKSHCIEEREK